MIQAINNYQFAQRKLISNLTGYYKFNNVGGATDYSLSPRNINAIMGAPLFEDGKLGLCCTFNAQQTGFRSPNIPPKYKFDSGDGITPLPFSISFWMKIASNSVSTNGYIFGLTGSISQWVVQYITTVNNISYNTLRFMKQDSGLNKKRFISLPKDTLPLNEWIFITITDSGIGTEKIYVNGVLKNTEITDNGYVSFLSGNPYGIGISAQAQANYNGFFFPGSLDDIAIFKDYILTIDDIGWIYNNGNGNEII